ncbi:MAG TPA: RNA-binding S4 domain-containing protein [Gemmatimonadales bacterium]|jgi:ribosome-associated heat shock protein Hsp15
MSDESVRLDKWLWAARFFKTRSAATEAVNGGKVDVNGDRAKPARSVRPGDTVQLRIPPYDYRLLVTGTAERRGSAAAASALYQETPESRDARERLREQLRLAPAFEREGKPGKKDRRAWDRWRGRS